MTATRTKTVITPTEDTLTVSSSASNPSSSSSSSSSSAPSSTPALPFYTPAEILKHNKKGDAWMYIGDDVYDVTEWIDRHPGGKIIAEYAGYDATEPFNMVHRNAVSFTQLKKLHIGKVQRTEPVGALEAEFRELNSKLKALGLFNYSMTFFVLQMLHVYAMVAASYWLINHCSFSGHKLLGYVLFSYMVGQAGWMQHDLGHNSVFKSYLANRMWHRFVIGVTMGASSGYWRSAHWKHHIYTNVEGLDHDIDTLPLFAWSEAQLRKAGLSSSLVHKVQSWYWYVVGPTLSFNYICFLSMVYMYKRKIAIDIVSVALHFYLYHLLIGSPALWWTFLTRIFSYALSGTYMGHMFSLNHFAMDMFENEELSPEQIIRHQVTTTRNVDNPYIHSFWHYLSGGLGYQIEHHLFPMMPRYNLPIAAEYVKELCRKHGLKHVTVGILQAFADVKRTLDAPHPPHVLTKKKN